MIVGKRRYSVVWALLGLAGLALAVALAVHFWPRPDPNRVWREAELALQSDQFDQAEAAVRRLAGLRSPTDIDLMLRSQVALARNRPDEAIATLRRIPDGSPVAAHARLLAGQTELRGDRLRFAEQELKSATRLDPTLKQAWSELIYIYGMQSRRRELGEALQRLSELTPLRADQAYLWTLTRGTVWEATEVVEYMTRYLKADPDDRHSRLGLSDALQHLGRLDEAQQALEPLPQDDPDACVARARIAIQKGDNAAAERALAQGPESHPGVALLRGKMALLKRDATAAARHFRTANAAEPNNRDIIVGLSQALRMLGDPAESARYAKMAHGHDVLTTLMQYAAKEEGKADPTLPLKMGAALEAIGRYPEARAWYQVAVDNNPLDPLAQKALFRIKAATASPTHAVDRPN